MRTFSGQVSAWRARCQRAWRSSSGSTSLTGEPRLEPLPGRGQRDDLAEPEASRARARRNLERDHTEQDDDDPAWDLSGMVQQAQFVLDLGRPVADAPDRPTWRTP
jgi:hypothetical protein